MATFKKRPRKNGTTAYQATVRLAGYPRKHATFAKLVDAKGWASGLETEMRAGRYNYELLAQKRTVEELLQRYMDTVLEVKSSKPRYIAVQRSQLLWWKKRIGQYTVNNITSALIGDCRDELLNGKHGKCKKPATVNRYLAALSHVFTTAVNEWEWMNKNPLPAVRKPIEPRGRVRFLSDKELVALLAACKTEKRKPLYLIVVLAISTGARKMELLSLRWRDVDLKRRCITVQETKNGERRSLFLSSLSLELMKAYAKRRTQSGLVFASRNKLPMNIEAEWRRATRKAGITDFRFHDLRHTFASYLAMNGASLAELKDALGHKTLNMVARYAHLCETHMSKVIGSMNEKVFSHMEIQA